MATVKNINAYSPNLFKNKKKGEKDKRKECERQSVMNIICDDIFLIEAETKLIDMMLLSHYTFTRFTLFLYKNISASILKIVSLLFSFHYIYT